MSNNINIKKKKSLPARIIKLMISILLVFVLVTALYIIYLQCSYYKIKDNKNLNIKNNVQSVFDTNKNYTITSYNIGFGAYERDFSFFMDTSTDNDGNEITGQHGKAISKKNVLKNTEKCIETLKKQNSDIYLLQEVDTDSSRSYKVNQVNKINESFNNYASIYAVNFHSKFLPYPINDMHGYVNSGILTLSKYRVDSAVRRSYPTTTSFIAKFTDLDRCFCVTRYKVKDGKELVIVNSHMSAYDKGGTIRKKQLKKLNKFMQEELSKNNYVIVGGDFNHEYAGTIDIIKGNKRTPEWLARINTSNLTDGFSFVIPENFKKIGTCRGAEEPYDKYKTYQCTIDGFIVSDNIEATAKIIDTQFESSDHNPIIMTFKLK